ncbi:MAG: hypothetical protein ABW202_01835 [Duganella sp.]
MSTQRIIHLADLAFIENGIRSIRSDVDVVSQQVESVGQEVTNTRSELAALEQLFRDFLAADAMAKELQLAETRQVKIRQELKTTYGYYDVVRRTATGILQAADISVVRQETMTSATEELMLSAPRYWLAPALVALSAWLNDNQPLANKALSEALRRDDEKTTLFFALITRRASRVAASATWMDRYFGMQDPLKLDRQTVVLVDALASGVFGQEVRNKCTERTQGWIEELSQRAGFIEEQRKQWTAGLRSKTPKLDSAQRYSYLKKYSPTWGELDTTLNSAGLNAVVHDHFKNIFDGEIPPSPNIQAAVDQLLEKLVKNFDDEELPLRREDRLCQLVIDERGNRNAAQNRYQLESAALDEQISFTQLLTNAAMHPETSHASRATQRYATALSKAWIKDAHSDITASTRAAVPLQVGFDIEGWKGQTRNGENEADLAASLGAHIDAAEANALAAVKLGLAHWAAVVIGGLFVLVGLPSLNLLLLGLGAGAVIWFFVAKSKLAKTKEAISAKYATVKQQSLEIVKAAVAEVVEWRRDFARRDAVAADVTAFLDGISAQQFVQPSHDKVRQVMA